VRFERGQVTEVSGLPPEIAFQVLNYDVEKLGPGVLTHDENGHPCEIKEWHAPE
jgi:hypothetical protein